MSTQPNSKANIAEADYPIHEIIKQRWSPRSFSDESVEPELLRQLFDATRWAPSSYNEQPWRFIVATKNHPDEHAKMADILNTGNQRWAKKAPVLILTVVKESFAGNGAMNRSAEHDLGQAVATLTFEATRHDLYLHQMAGIDLEQARQIFSIPEGFKPFTVIALGYINQRKSVPTARSRKEVDEIAFRGDWNSRKQLV